MKTLQVLGFLLTYPSAKHKDILPECREILEKEKWLSSETLIAIDDLINWMEKQEYMDLQEEYVSLFDRTPSLCLHLFEHVHGDSRERGQALVDLSTVYKDAGLLINTNEMPDYLPLFLEYLSIIPAEEARETLGNAIDVIGAVGSRLQNRGSKYAVIFEALKEASVRKPDPKAVAQALKDDAGSAMSLADIDKVWEEQSAFENTEQTTGSDAGCSMVAGMVDSMNKSIESDNKETRQ